MKTVFYCLHCLFDRNCIKK